MVFYGKRDKFSSISAGMGRAFRKLGLSPNQLTFISIIPAAIAAYLVSMGDFVAAAALFMVAAVLDMADGAVARCTGKVTNMGAYLDTMVDRYVEFMIALGLLFLSLRGGIPDFIFPAQVWLFVFMFGALMTSYSKAAAKEKELVRAEIKGGLIERAERLLILFTGILLAVVNPIYLTYAIVLLAFLANVTALQRAWIAKVSCGKA